MELHGEYTNNVATKEGLMSYEFYETLHIISIIMVFIALGAVFIQKLNSDEKQYQGKTLISILHGIGMLLLLVAGFGLAAKKQLGMPGWVYIKLVIWLLLGALYGVAQRRPAQGKVWLLSSLTLALVAVVIGVHHVAIFGG